MLFMVGFTANSMGRYWSEIQMMHPPWNDTTMYNGCTRCMDYGGGKGGAGCTGELCDCWIVDYDDPDQQVTCQLYGMPDVDQDNHIAHEALKNYVGDVVNRFGIDGVRLDAVPYMPKHFWRDFSVASGVMAMGEVETGNDAVVSPYVREGVLDSVLNYPLYYQLLNCFTLSHAPGNPSDPQSRWGLDTLPSFFATQAKNYGDAVKILGNFVSNHDQPRLDSLNPDKMLQKALVLTMMTSVGMPIIYYGMEQGLQDRDVKFSFDIHREVLWPTKYQSNATWYRWLATIGQVRQMLPKEDFAHAGRIDLWAAPDLYVYMRGKVLVAVTNVGASFRTIEQDIKTPFKEGTPLLDAFDGKISHRVRREGWFRIRLCAGESKMYVPSSEVFAAASAPAPAPAASLGLAPAPAPSPVPAIPSESIFM
mmetsp:Transcript_160470/g.295735  ORF Transcript_160470/g.295735 Transcript_160470/m.295735 type:complete len:421 (-) Transcript_160470:92-1354(-)